MIVLKEQAIEEPMLCIGKVGAPWGVKGFVRVSSFTEDPESILEYQPLWLNRKGMWSECDIEEYKVTPKAIYVRFAGIDDRSEAEKLTHLDIYMPKSCLPECGPSQYYWTDLEGLKVYDTQDELLGVCEYLYATPAYDNMVVAKEKKKVHIPFVMDKFVKGVDVEQGRITVDWAFSD